MRSSCDDRGPVETVAPRARRKSRLLAMVCAATLCLPATRAQAGNEALVGGLIGAVGGLMINQMMMQNRNVRKTPPRETNVRDKSRNKAKPAEVVQQPSKDPVDAKSVGQPMQTASTPAPVAPPAPSVPATIAPAAVAAPYATSAVVPTTVSAPRGPAALPVEGVPEPVE